MNMKWPQLLVITTLSVLMITREQAIVGHCQSIRVPAPQNPPRHVYLVPTDTYPYNALNSNNYNNDDGQQVGRLDTGNSGEGQMPLKRMIYQQAKVIETTIPPGQQLSTSLNRGYVEQFPPPQWRIGLPAKNSEVSEIVIEHMQTAASGDSDLTANNDNNNNNYQQLQQLLTKENDKSFAVINARRYNLMNQQQLDNLLNGRRYKKTKSIQTVHNRLGQLSSTNASFEDINWKIAATCLRSHFGPQYIYNKDLKCASSQIVLTISRMQRASCKSCEGYFHCEAFSNAIKNCKNNYDVQETIGVIKNCKDLFILGDDEENIQAAENGYIGIDCKKMYLCKNNCMYNPSDNTCPRNNCMNEKFGQLPKWQYMRADQTNSSYFDRSHDKLGALDLDEKGKVLPRNSPMHAKEAERISGKQIARINRQDQIRAAIAGRSTNKYRTNNNGNKSNSNNDNELKTGPDHETVVVNRDRARDVHTVNVSFPLI